MAHFNVGTVVLVKFPFTDTASFKRRPALVLLDNDDHDLLLARITTQQCDSPFDYELKDWMRAALKAPSFVRLHKLATLEKRLIERELGQLTLEDLRRIREIWQRMVEKI